jgi:hypothetical protein
VLLSRYYCQWTPRLRRPGAIAPYSTLIVKGIAGAVARRLEGPESRLNFGQVGPFIRDQQARAEVVLRFRTERPPFWALNDHLVTALISRRKMIPGCGHGPDPSGSSSGKQTRTRTREWLGCSKSLFSTSKLLLVRSARHFVQIDELEAVAPLILSLPIDSGGRDVDT